MNKKRKPNRLTDYDYTQNGAYFITICVNDRKPILSSITVGANCVRLKYRYKPKRDCVTAISQRVEKFK